MIEIGWRQAQSLRCSVLGWGCGPVPGDEDAGTVHLGMADGPTELVGVVSFLAHPYPALPARPAVYLWAMAIRPDRQGQGVGTRLLHEVLHRASAIGAGLVWADARLSAVSFYQRHGASAVAPAVQDPIAGVATGRVLFELP